MMRPRKNKKSLFYSKNKRRYSHDDHMGSSNFYKLFFLLLLIIGGNSLMMIMMIRPRSPIIIRTNKDTAMTLTLTLITPQATAPYPETLLIQLIEGELFNCFGCSFLLFLAEITCKTFKDKQSYLIRRHIPS